GATRSCANTRCPRTLRGTRHELLRAFPRKRSRRARSRLRAQSILGRGGGASRLVVAYAKPARAVGARRDAPARRRRRDLRGPMGFARRGRPRVHGTGGAGIAAQPEGPLPLRFSDGSLVSLYAGSRARVAASDENGARVVIERGGASGSVTHRAASRWAFDVGPFEVVVVGT